MADVAIISSPSVAAPKDYTIPNAQEIAPKAIRAVLDGTNAAGSWLPALQVLAPNGTVMFTAIDRNVVLSAGATASVSWFPRIAGATVSQGGPPGNGCVRFVGPPTGTASVDTSNIQTALDSLPSNGGIVQLCRGTYAITALTISTPALLSGHGGGTGYTAATELAFDSATGVAVTIASTGVTLRDFKLKNTSSTTPTAGSGVQVGTSANHAGGSAFLSVTVTGFYTNVDLQYPGSSYVFHRCEINDMVATGISVQNLANADEGDGAIVDSFIITGPNNLGSNIHGVNWQSSGGLRVIGNKFNSTAGSPGPTNAVGLNFNPSDGISTSIILIGNNSIEAYSYGTVFKLTSALSTGVLTSIVVNGNEILAATTGVYIAPPVAGKIANIAVGENIILGATIGLSLANIDNIKYGPNVYANCTTNINVGAGVTNATVVGGG